MSRARFGVLLALVVLVLAVGSFVLVLNLVGDDEPSAGTVASTTTASVLPTTTLPEDALQTPTFVAIVTSNSDEGTAQAMAAELTERGYDGGVLRSADHTSLEPGFWVAYVGPFPDVAGAQAVADQLKGDGYSAAYPRCVGTAEQCA